MRYANGNVAKVTTDSSEATSAGGEELAINNRQAWPRSTGRGGKSKN